MKAYEKRNDEREWDDSWRGDEFGCFVVVVAALFVLAMAVLR